MILFVDDLDRCAAKTIVTMLDAVRLVMDAPGIIVVIAIDPGVLMEAVTSEEAYGKRGRDYLSKIIQLPIHLGRPQGPDLKGFARDLILVTERDLVKEQTNESTPEIHTRPTNRPVDSEDHAGAGSVNASGSEASGDEIAGATRQADSKPSTEIEGDKPTAIDTRPEAIDPTSKQLDAAMGHTQKEQTLFAELTGILSIDNPRRLIRLRNTYRLMKLIWFRSLSDKERESYDPLIVMQVLFIADTISEWDPSENGMVILKQLEHKRVDKTAIKYSDHAAYLLLQSQVSSVIKIVDGTYPDVTHRVAGELFRLARSLLLPHPEFDPGPAREDGSEDSEKKK